MPLLRASGNASVINTSSVLGLVGSGAAAAYQASKGAVRLLSKTAAVEYARQGVRGNSIHPGVVATPMIQDLRAGRPATGHPAHPHAPSRPRR